MQSKVKILSSDNAGTLHDKLMNVGQELVLETIQKINQSAETKPQINNKELKPAPKLFKENCKIKWDKNAKQIVNQIRGLNPYPGAWTFLINNGIKIEIKILKVKFERQSHSYKIGNVISDKSSIKICILEGFINLIEFKFPGKKQMNVKSFLNGFSFDINAKMI
jgi:methionyl-tRNA formyltransferase